MLTPIAQSHLAAIESELARIKAQRDALRDAAQFASDFYQRNFDAMPVAYQSVDSVIGVALQACQD